MTNTDFRGQGYVCRMCGRPTSLLSGRNTCECKIIFQHKDEGAEMIGRILAKNNFYGDVGLQITNPVTHGSLTEGNDNGACGTDLPVRTIGYLKREVEYAMLYNERGLNWYVKFIHRMVDLFYKLKESQWFCDIGKDFRDDSKV